jgi:thiosulfate/3-mercaptopyruvate sulfurtransferase
MLRFLGHAAVAVLDGGFAAWTAAGHPVVSGPADPRAPRDFHPRPQPDQLAGVKSVLEGLGREDCVIVDARAADRFAGHNETLDPVAGHIPGARNHPFTRNLDEHGRFLQPDELARRWQATLSGAPPHAVICMCGSGVTACHNLLALEHAGLRGARLYAGSWSEWIRDPTRPVARE